MYVIQKHTNVAQAIHNAHQHHGTIHKLCAQSACPVHPIYYLQKTLVSRGLKQNILRKQQKQQCLILQAAHFSRSSAHVVSLTTNTNNAGSITLNDNTDAPPPRDSCGPNAAISTNLRKIQVNTKGKCLKATTRCAAPQANLNCKDSGSPSPCPLFLFITQIPNWSSLERRRLRR